jgi:hypothetical protein
MALYVYKGRDETLYFAGNPSVGLHRGVPVELAGAMALTAERHPDVERVDGEPADDSPEPKAAEVRAWAREHGIEVSARGSITPELMERYKAAQRG